MITEHIISRIDNHRTGSLLITQINGEEYVFACVNHGIFFKGDKFTAIQQEGSATLFYKNDNHIERWDLFNKKKQP